MDDATERIIDFSLYCGKCRYRDKLEHEKPCCECLCFPTSDTREPVKYEEAKRRNCK